MLNFYTDGGFEIEDGLSHVLSRSKVELLVLS